MPLITLLGWLLIVSANAGSPTWNELRYESESGRAAGTLYGIRWSAEGARCEITRARSGKAPIWSAAPAGSCAKVAAYANSHRSALDAKAGQPREFGERTPHGTLTLGNQSWVARTDTAETCDANMTHCAQLPLDAPSELCVLLRDIITEKLGRL